MKNFIIIFSLFIVSCQGNTEVERQDVPQKETVESMSNPAFMQGSDFGNLFQTLYRLGNFDDMMKFTSTGSIEHHGRDKVLKYYKTMEFGFTLKLVGQNVIGDTIQLNYTSRRVATKGVTRMLVVVENDTCKLVLPDNLNNLFTQISE